MGRKSREEAKATRESLLVSALNIMSEKPYSKVSMSAIAEAIGLSKGATYWHFRNKEDVLVNLIENCCLMGEREMREVIADTNSAAGIREYYKLKLEKTYDNSYFKKFSALMHRRIEWPESIQEQVYDMIHESIKKENKMVRDFLASEQKRGNLKGECKPDEMANVITSLMHGLMSHQLFEISDQKMSLYVDMVFDALDGEIFRQDNSELTMSKIV